MSDAVVALISAAVTTIGLAIINKLMARPGEQWKQASDIREELRNDLVRAHTELSSLRQISSTRDREVLELHEKLLELRVDLKALTVQLEQCHENHEAVRAELIAVRAEFGKVVRQNHTPHEEV